MLKNPTTIYSTHLKIPDCKMPETVAFVGYFPKMKSSFSTGMSIVFFDFIIKSIAYHDL